jgi:hypothetical protein
MAMVLADTSRIAEHHGRADAQNEGFHISQGGNEAETKRLLAFAAGGLGGIAEDLVNRSGRARDRPGGIHADEEETRLPFGPRHRFFQLRQVEIQAVAGWIYAVDTAQCELEVRGKDRAQQDDPLAHFPSMFLGQLGFDDAAGSVLPPGFYWLRSHALIPSDIHIRGGIGAELREMVLRPVVFVFAAEKSQGHNVGDSGNGSYFLPIKTGQKKGQRNPLAGHQAQGGVRRSGIDERSRARRSSGW